MGVYIERVLEPVEAMVSLSSRSLLLLTCHPQMRSKGWQVEFTLTACLKILTQLDANSDPNDVFDRSLPFIPLQHPKAQDLASLCAINEDDGSSYPMDHRCHGVPAHH